MACVGLDYLLTVMLNEVPSLTFRMTRERQDGKEVRMARNQDGEGEFRRTKIGLSGERANFPDGTHN